MSAIELKNLSISHHGKPVLQDINGNFVKGSLTAITGRNGAGKTTLLKAISGIIPADKGAIKINIKDNKIAYLPQVSEIEKDFPISVLNLVVIGYTQCYSEFSAITDQMKKRAIDAIEEVGLAGLENENIASLSFGQFQRALFARLIIQDADLILLDEPFAAIDFPTIEKLTNIIKKWHQGGRTIICVLHDFEQIKNTFHDCLVLDQKCLAWDKAEKALKDYQLQPLSCH